MQENVLLCLKNRTMDLDKFDLPLSQLEDQILSWVKEALDLRFAQRGGESLVPDQGSSPVLNGLLSVRARLDRLEELLASATRARGRAARATAIAKAVSDDAWDSQSQVELQRTQRHGEFVAPRERYANSNLETLNQKRDFRAAERLQHCADEAYEVIRLVYRGLDGVRQDHLAVIRALSFESHLERSSVDRGY